MRDHERAEGLDRSPEKQEFTMLRGGQKKRRDHVHDRRSLLHPSQRLPTDGGKIREPGEIPLRRRCPQPESLSQTNSSDSLSGTSLRIQLNTLSQQSKDKGKAVRAEKTLNHKKLEGRTEWAKRDSIAT